MITSKQNTAIKEIRSLSMKKFRDEKNEYLIESVKLVADAINTNQRIKRIFATEKGASLLREIINDVELELVTDEVFASISTEITPQGVIAVAVKPQTDFEIPSGSCLLLDGVSDPSNVGAIVRTASASNYNQLYLVDCADAFSPKSVRASMGGVFRVKIYTCTKQQALDGIKLPIVVADMKGENVFENTLKGDFCLVIGNEGHGVSQEVKSRASHTVSIPMQNGMESLNASVSAGILMYALKKN